MSKRKFSEIGRHVLVIDTETTGLPGCRGVIADATNFVKWNNARLVQIAWELYNPDRVCIDAQCHIIKPDGYVIPDVVTKIHGISTGQALNEGIPIKEAFDKLRGVLMYNPIIVAHNMDFDFNIILSELYRYFNMNYEMPENNVTDIIKTWIQADKECTMLMSCNPGERWKKLVVVYENLFGIIPDITLHRADNDVKLCSQIYFKLLDKMKYKTRNI